METAAVDASVKRAPDENGDGVPFSGLMINALISAGRLAWLQQQRAEGVGGTRN